MDISGVNYFLPAFSFVLVMVVIFAILKKIQILGESNGVIGIVSAVLALIFVSVTDVRLFVEAVTPWFAVIVLGLFFVMFLVYFGLKEPDKLMKPWVLWVFVGILVLFFLVQGAKIFNVSGNPDFISVRDWITSEKVAGSLWLVLFAAVAIFAVTKKVAGK